MTARKKVLQDLIGQLDESKRMQQNHNIFWHLRSWVLKIEYWFVAYAFPISIILWWATGDFYKGLGFWLATNVYVLSANFRGMSLHIENLVEWYIKKTI